MRALWSTKRTHGPEPSLPDQPTLFDPKAVATGEPLLVDVALIDEDPSNPRTEFPDAALDELAADIRQRGVLQPIVVHPADLAGRYRVHFGSMRLRAARRCGVAQVPIVVRSATHDPYAQVAENLKRQGLSPLDLARFIHSRVGAGESNAAVAAHLGMDQTTVAHHLALLELPPELDDALKSGRCTSPRTLYELSKLHKVQPERVKALVSGDSQITRATVATMRAEQAPAATRARPKRGASSLLAQANSACARLELALSRIKKVEHELVDAELVAVRQRVARLASLSV